MKGITESRKFNKNLRDKMFIEILNVDNIDYALCSGLCGYHVYQKNLEAIHWSGDNIDQKNLYDGFAISSSAKIPGKLGSVVIGPIPGELSRFMWYALDSWTIILGKVILDK